MGNSFVVYDFMIQVEINTSTEFLIINTNIMETLKLIM